MLQVAKDLDIIQLLAPENDLEAYLLGLPEFQEGLQWGEPRFGHPEGKVGLHVEEVYTNINRLEVPEATRWLLRIVALCHDTFKYAESKFEPRQWHQHHGILARQYLEPVVNNPLVLDLIELHDEAYYSWRYRVLHQQEEEGKARLERLIQRMGPDLQLYYLFFKCDTCTGDKNLAPLKWFEQHIQGIQIVNFISND